MDMVTLTIDGIKVEVLKIPQCLRLPEKLESKFHFAFKRCE